MDNKEQLLIEMTKQKEEAHKMLLRMETLMGLMALIPFIMGVAIGLCVPMAEWLCAFVVLTSMIPLLVSIPFLLRAEQVAGYYECRHCHHKHVPTYKAVFLAMHIGRARYLKCPECGKRSFNKKVLNKD